MSKPQNFDVAIIGAGAAGFSAAEAARALGASVCLIEKDKLGGECPNYACLPSKAMARAAAVFRAVRGAREYGTVCSGINLDFTALSAYRKKVVDGITGGGRFGARYEALARELGLTLFSGAASFIDCQTLSVNQAVIKAKTTVLATGAVDFEPSIPGLSAAHYLSSKSALMQNRLPKSLAIIGGGPVGSELASIFSGLGVRVILFEAAARILSRQDEELAALADASLRSQNVEIHDSARILEVIDARGGVIGLKVECRGRVETHAVEQIILAAGRRANTDGLNLEAAGIALDARGNIQTDPFQCTGSRFVFAAGDAAGEERYTHVAHHEGRVAGHNAALHALGRRGSKMKADLRALPSVIFLEPELAGVGPRTEDLKAKYGQLLVGRAAVADLGRAAADNERRGLCKIIAHPKTRKILACHIQSPHAGEIIHEAALSMRANATLDKITGTIHAFPTYSEVLLLAASRARLE